MTTHVRDGAAQRDDRLLECPICRLPAYVEDRFTLDGAPSPVEHVKLVCLAGHGCTLPIDQLPAAQPERHRAKRTARTATHA